MDHTGILSLDGVEVYGTIVRHSTGIRFRVWTREWQTLGFVAGQTLAVGHGNEPVRPMLMASAVATDNGNTWIEFGAPIHRPLFAVYGGLRERRAACRMPTLTVARTV